MENQRFDTLTRMLASGASRRTLLRAVFGGALAGIGLRAGVTAQKDKVDICHYDADTGSYHWISVNGNAVDAHLRHGDRTADYCQGNFELDFSTCECACDTNNLGCLENHVPDTDICDCVCEPDSLGCTGNLVPDTDICDCVCDPASLGCTGNLVPNTDSCSCVCGLTSCGAGSALNTDTCTCDPADACATPDGSPCDSVGNCARDIATGLNICVGIAVGIGCSQSGVCGQGQVCVVDANDQPHCHNQLS